MRTALIVILAVVAITAFATKHPILGVCDLALLIALGLLLYQARRVHR